MMDKFDIAKILARVSYKDWRFNIGGVGSDMFMQITFHAPDRDGGEPVEQRCRKWRLSVHMTESEVVQTAFLAVKVAEEHEVRETFKYLDARPFSPHVKIDALIAAGSVEDVRDEGGYQGGRGTTPVDEWEDPRIAAAEYERDHPMSDDGEADHAAEVEASRLR